MIKIAASAVALTFLAGAAFAGPRDQKKTAKHVDVKICPIMLNPVHGKGGGSVTYGKYHVTFCCPGCKPAFAKLNKAAKDKKIAAALKKQHARM